MPSRHPRIAVVRDPDLDRALERTRRLLPERDTGSAAAHLRALAVRGADALASVDEVEAERERLIKKYNMIPAKNPPRPGERLFPWLDEQEIDPENPTPATDALNWVRGKDRDY